MNDALLSHLHHMQAYFAAGHTQPYVFRRAALERLKDALYRYENELYEALYADLKKGKEECWVTEIGFVVAEINYAIKKLRRWMRPRRVKTNLLNFPASSYILHEPLGVVLIIGPWNYPLQLLLNPLVGAIAAGNVAVLKPSEFAPVTAAVIEKIIAEIFDARFVTVVQGDGVTVIPAMLDGFRFDHIFYTGSTTVGTLVYEAAAKKLVPVTLELGGKSPCIVESDADINVAARRIAMTKFSNAGQMCVAPDYVLVHASVQDKLVNALKRNIEAFYTAENVRSGYGKIVNERQWRRLVQYIEDGTVLYGGGHDAAALHISPTLITNMPSGARIMQDEIFGPVLPIISWQEETEVYDAIAQHKNPLALYVFSASKRKAGKWIRSIPFGGGCINNASWQLTNYHLPFGGRGSSGTGRYHGWYSFETFSHKKGILESPTWFDPAFKYPPLHGKLKWFKKIIR